MSLSSALSLLSSDAVNTFIIPLRISCKVKNLGKSLICENPEFDENSGKGQGKIGHSYGFSKIAIVEFHCLGESGVQVAVK